MDTKIGRRDSLKVVGFGFLGAAGLINLAACSKKESAGGAEGAGSAEKAPTEEAPAKQAEAAGGEGCDAAIEPASTQMRTALQYKQVSDQEGKSCSSCAQFKPGEYGDCGGCNLFTGPVQSNGYCLSWAAKEG
ncbi:MAG: high-potential iron-sulfur protein [Polyangiales bacterium]